MHLREKTGSRQFLYWKNTKAFFPNQIIMQSEILLIGKEQVCSLRDRLRDPDKLSSCIEEVRRMVEIKSVLSWRADERMGCCGPGLPMYLFGEVQTLEMILIKLESGNIDEAISLLKDYEVTLIDTQ